MLVGDSARQLIGGWEVSKFGGNRTEFGDHWGIDNEERRSERSEMANRMGTRYDWGSHWVKKRRICDRWICCCDWMVWMDLYYWTA